MTILINLRVPLLAWLIAFFSSVVAGRKKLPHEKEHHFLLSETETKTTNPLFLTNESCLRKNINDKTVHTLSTDNKKRKPA